MTFVGVPATEEEEEEEEEKEEEEEEEEGHAVKRSGVEYSSHPLTSDIGCGISTTHRKKIIVVTTYINTSLNSHSTGVCS